MMQMCRVCGVLAGGLVSEPSVMVQWPEVDLCPQCPPTAPKREDEAMRAIIERVRRETADVAKAKRDGEFPTAEIMGMVLR